MIPPELDPWIGAIAIVLGLAGLFLNRRLKSLYDHQLSEIVATYEQEIKDRADEHEKREEQYHDLVDILLALAWHNGDELVVPGIYMKGLDADPTAPRAFEILEHESDGTIKIVNRRWAEVPS